MEDIKKHSFKIQIGTAITVMIFIVGYAYMFGSYKKEMDTKAANCEVGMKALELRVTANEKNGSQRDIIMERILTKLDNIEKLLQDK